MKDNLGSFIILTGLEGVVSFVAITLFADAELVPTASDSNPKPRQLQCRRSFEGRNPLTLSNMNPSF